KETAISYAVYRVLLDQYHEDSKYITDQFTKMGYDPKNMTSDISKPEGIGNKVAKSIIEFRHHDGSNQLGDEPGGNGKPFSDYTYYKPVNSYKHVIDPDRWHPLPFVDNKGDTFLVNFLTPQWYRVKPFGLVSSNQFRAPEPPKVGSEQMKKEVEEVVNMNAHLDHTCKATIEFMRDGPRSTGQAGHWLKFAQMVSVRDHNDLDTDVKMFFAVGVTAMDAFIACWETKRYYDSSRPWTLVRQYYAGQQIQGWGGPDKGTVSMPAERWHPYSPANFVSPPFPAYVSGHSTVSGACGKLLELFTGSDRFGETEHRICGIITETPGDPVSLPLPTFSATSELAGISRVLGGYHIQADNIAGLKMGRDIANYEWGVLKSYFDGTKK
ncbi:MAG: vanadium-dependent haloperoxidase, partial [Saprospiraceae bacterium]